MVDHNNIPNFEISIPDHNNIRTIDFKPEYSISENIPTIDSEPIFSISENILTLDSKKQMANTAANLAYIISAVFSTGILLCFLFLFAVFSSPSRITEKPDGSKLFEKDVSQGFEMFKNFSVVISSPLGFVLGFYFRQTKRE